MSVTIINKAKEKESEKEISTLDSHELSLNEPALHSSIEWSDSLLAHARELWHHRELLWLVTMREIKVRYKQTALGAAWALLQPLSLMLVFTVFIGQFAKVESEGLPYPLFSYTALLPWTFFATSLSFAIPSLITNSNIITKIYFPREIIPLASVMAALLDFAVATILYVVMLGIYWKYLTFSWNMLYVIPLLLVQVIFTTGVCLGASAFTVLYRDVRFTLPLLIQIWMYISPVLYSADKISHSKYGVAYFALNPMAVIIDGYRKALLHGKAPDIKYLGLAAVVSMILLWGGYKYFKHLERQFADIV
jgi:lipopolysaccharide transport system permease protein